MYNLFIILCIMYMYAHVYVIYILFTYYLCITYFSIFVFLRYIIYNFCGKPPPK